MGKKTKGHDKDKYYHLAKDQGYRARSAFKLIEINKKYGFLNEAKVCIDLCAAPGGWCQVASKFMPRGSIILGVDLLPIRPIPNVKTLIHDITTEECRTALKREMQNWKADVVLCDGAPNVGTAYKKDAYEQNEIALAALKVATQQLRKGGTFVTKVYRSQDYNSLMWVIQQFFTEHQAVKPASSRSQSAEIFVVGKNFTAPDYIDPRVLDPRHAFKQDFDEGNKKGVTIFHKKFDQHNKRQRQGYDDDLGMSLTRSTKVSTFVDSDDPVRVLTDAHVLEFGPDCELYKEHRSTTEEIKGLCAESEGSVRYLPHPDHASSVGERVPSYASSASGNLDSRTEPSDSTQESNTDLRVLGKGDFRQLVKWRLKLVKYRDELLAAAEERKHGKEEEESEDEEEEKTEEEKEEDVQEEIKTLQLRALAEKKRLRKKEREAAARLRARVAMGMENKATDLPEEEGIFTLKSIETLEELDSIREVDLSKLRGDEVDVMDAADHDLEEKEDEVEVEVDSDEEDAQLQEELNEAYLRYLEAKDDNRTDGTGHLKRSRKAKAAKAAEEEMRDTILYDGDQQRYMEMLGGFGEGGVEDSDVSSDTSGDMDEEEDGDSDDIVERRSGQPDKENYVEIGKNLKSQSGARNRHPLLAEIGTKSERQYAAADRWFSNPLFAGVEAAEEHEKMEVEEKENDSEGENEEKSKGKRARLGDEEEEGEAAAVLASMPKTDKEKRKEKRKKSIERKERREVRHGKRLSEDGVTREDMQVVSGNDDLEDLDPKERAKMEHKRKLIRQGMGVAQTEGEDAGFEVAKASNAASAIMGVRQPKFGVKGIDVKDERAYGSEEEYYDDEDRAQQLALGTMMLRKHRAKELVDAAYNRFSWNDDADLPDWFKDDESKHYRPQVPLPAALVEQMKQKFMSLASKPIKKVAEARARKRKRASDRLRAAKSKATVLAGNPDMTEREKLKAVQRVMRRGSAADIPSKVYVVAKSGGRKAPVAGGSAKGARVKMVDKRMKSDARGAKRAEQKKTGKYSTKKRKGRGRQGRH